MRLYYFVQLAVLLGASISLAQNALEPDLVPPKPTRRADFKVILSTQLATKDHTCSFRMGQAVFITKTFDLDDCLKEAQESLRFGEVSEAFYRGRLSETASHQYRRILQSPQPLPVYDLVIDGQCKLESLGVSLTQYPYDCMKAARRNRIKNYKFRDILTLYYNQFLDSQPPR